MWGAGCLQAKDDAECEADDDANDEETGEGAVLSTEPGEEDGSLNHCAPAGIESERVMRGEGSDETEKR